MEKSRFGIKHALVELLGSLGFVWGAVCGSSGVLFAFWGGVFAFFLGGFRVFFGGFWRSFWVLSFSSLLFAPFSSLHPIQVVLEPPFGLGRGFGPHIGSFSFFAFLRREGAFWVRPCGPRFLLFPV